MNMSMQLGRGLAAVTLGAIVSAYALTRTAAAADIEAARAMPMLATIHVTASPAVVARTQAVSKRQRCESHVVVGVPITLGAHVAAKLGDVANPTL